MTAGIDLQVQNLGITLQGDGSLSQIVLKMITAAGVNVDPTGGSFQLNAIQTVPSGFGNAPAFGTVPVLTSYASGVTVLQVTGPTGVSSGAYKYELLFTPSGGTAQVCAIGTLTLN